MDKKRDIGRIADALKRKVPLPHRLLDPCCGNMQLANRLRSLGHSVEAYDYCNGYGKDFLSTFDIGDASIVTVPPKTSTEDYVMHALSVLRENAIAAMLIRTSFLEGQDRYKRIFNRYPPYKVLQFSERVDETRTAYSWFVWIKGRNTPTILEWT